MGGQQAAGVGMPKLNFGQQPQQDPSQTGRHGKSLGAKDVRRVGVA